MKLSDVKCMIFVENLHPWKSLEKCNVWFNSRGCLSLPWFSCVSGHSPKNMVCRDIHYWEVWVKQEGKLWTWYVQDTGKVVERGWSPWFWERLTYQLQCWSLETTSKAWSTDKWCSPEQNTPKFTHCCSLKKITISEHNFSWFHDWCTPNPAQDLRTSRNVLHLVIVITLPSCQT